MSLKDLIDATVRCTKCGAGFGKCDCWRTCKCGWFAEKGKRCRNPECGGDGIGAREVVAVGSLGKEAADA